MRKRIGFKKRLRTFSLGATDIDDASEWLVAGLSESGVDKSDCLRMRLLFEEALLNFSDHFGQQAQAEACLDQRQGRHRLRLTVKGNRFNPMKRTDEGEESVFTSLFSVIDLHVQYSYSRGSNVIRMSIPLPSMNPVLKIGIAIAIGVLVGVLGNIMIPDAAQEAFSAAVLNPIADMWVRLLQAISGPIIFLTALTATFDTKRIADLGGSRISPLIRYFAISALVVVFTLICSRPFFPLAIAETSASGSILTDALDGILQIIPGNFLEPFAEANTPQLLLIAIATGYLLASMDSQVSELKRLVQQLNALGLTVSNQACSLVPFFVGLLLCLKMWTHDTALLGATWVPLVLSAAISASVLAIALLATCARFRVSPLVMANKLRSPFVDALKRGTLDFGAVDDLARSCKRTLGIDSEFARAALPQGLFLYMPTSAVGICVFVLFAAQIQQLEIDQVWFISLAALSVILAVATPPVTGANLLSFVMAFSYLGISSDAFLDVMIFDIIFGVLCIAFDQAMLQIEVIHQAERMGFLDEAALRAPLACNNG